LAVVPREVFTTMTKLSQFARDGAVALALGFAVALVFLADRIGRKSEQAPEDEGQQVQGNVFRPTSVYAKRTAPKREEWIEQLGGSTISEKAVRDGLDWLARHQAGDGSWSNRCLGRHLDSRCTKESYCGGPGLPYEIAQTGLALLAFQAGGHFYFNKAEYSQVVRRGLDWLVQQQKVDGSLVGALGPDHPHYMYQHGIGAFALAEACAVAADANQPVEGRYLNAATQAIYYIVSQQHLDGGWRYTHNPNDPCDTSVSGWQVLALKTAREAHIAVDLNCVDKVREFFKNCEDGGKQGRTMYVRGQLLSEATTGVGMLVHQFLLETPDSALVRMAAPHLADHAEKTWGAKTGRSGRPDYYLWYNCTLAMFQAGGTSWDRWNLVVRDAVLKLQETKGCARGSWAPADGHDHAGGRIYTTALAVLTLEVYYRYAGKEKK
jgi:hypothetical protein